MNVQRSQEIREYLQRQVVQERIRRSIQNARSNITVTISRAAGLFGFSESQLREWEKKGLLTTDRLKQDGKEGHRQYTTNELSKLAVFQELFKNGGYSPGDIPSDFDVLWEHIENEQQNAIPVQADQVAQPRTLSPISVVDTHKSQFSEIPIDHRIEYAEQEVFLAILHCTGFALISHIDL